MWYENLGNLLLRLGNFQNPESKIDIVACIFGQCCSSTMQEVGSMVPEALQEVFSFRLADLPRAYIIILKVRHKKRIEEGGKA